MLYGRKRASLEGPTRSGACNGFLALVWLEGGEDIAVASGGTSSSLGIKLPSILPVNFPLMEVVSW